MQGTTRVVSGQSQPTFITGQSSTTTSYGGVTGTRTLGATQAGASYSTTSSYNPAQAYGQSSNTLTVTQGPSTTLTSNYSSVPTSSTTGTSYSTSTTLGSRPITGNVISSTGTASTTSYGQTSSLGGATYTSGQGVRTVSGTGTTSTTSTTGLVSGQYSSYQSTSQGARVVSGPPTTSGTILGNTSQYQSTSTSRPATTTYPTSTITSATGASGTTQTITRPSQTSRVVQGVTSTGGAISSTATGGVIRTTQPTTTTIEATGTTYGAPITTIGGTSTTIGSTSYNTTLSRPATTTIQGPSQTYSSHTTQTTYPTTSHTNATVRNTTAVVTQEGAIGVTSVQRAPEVHYTTPSQTNFTGTVSVNTISDDKNPFGPLGRIPTTTIQQVSTGYTLELDDDDDDDEVVEDRRFTEDTARTLARILFGRYDENRSGFLNSYETSSLITDFYCSLNIDHPSSRKEGFDFMVANDINNDGEFSVKDFEDIFVHHLSTGNNTSGYKLFSDRKVTSVKAEFGGRGDIQVAVKEQTQTKTAPQPVPQRCAPPTTTTNQVNGVDRFKSAVGKVAQNAWDHHQETILAQIREKGRLEGIERGMKDAMLMATQIEQTSATSTYEEGFKLGIQHGLDDGFRRAEETYGASDILFNKWKWQPEIVKAASNMIEHKASLPIMDDWHWQEAILTAANQIWKEQEGKLMALIQEQVSGTVVADGSTSQLKEGTTTAQPDLSQKELSPPKEHDSAQKPSSPSNHFDSQIEDGKKESLPAPITPVTIPDVPAKP